MARPTTGDAVADVTADGAMADVRPGGPTADGAADDVTAAVGTAPVAKPAEAVDADRAAPPRRTVEVCVTVAGMVLSGVFLGGFSVVMNQVGEGAFRDSLYPDMVAAGIDLSAAGDPYTAARTLGAWFGFTLMGVLALGTAGVLVARRAPGRRATGWLLAAAGLVCLVGSQLMLYPVAFLFFVSAGLFALRGTDRQPDPGSPR